MFNRYIILSVLAALLVSCSEGDMRAYGMTEETKVMDISVKEFKELSEKNDGILLDVRTQEEINDGYIQGASFIDFYDDEFKEKVNLMNKGKAIHVYCRSGGRSRKAAEILLQNGFEKVYNLNGGIGAWKEADYPLVSSSLTVDTNIKEFTLREFDKILSTSLPVLVDFHTKWCAPCKRMAPIVDDLEEAYRGRAEILRIDADQSKEIATNFKIKGVPVFIMFLDGEEKWRHIGAISEAELSAKINNYITQ